MRSGCVPRSTGGLFEMRSGCVPRSTGGLFEMRSGCVRRLSRELAQEAQIVLEEEPDVVHAVLQHRDSLDAHAERPAGDLLGIVADVLQDLGMHHPRAEDLEPARLLADSASLAGAEEAHHVDLRRRLGERKERRTKPDLAARAEHLAREQIERALEIGHGDVVIDGETLDLVEHRRVRDVGVATIDHAGTDDTYRRLLGAHRADLHRRRVRAQECLGRQVERVLHVARGVIARNVQRLEVVGIGLDLRALGHAEAEAGEDRDDLLAHAHQRVHDAARRTSSGQREIRALALALTATFVGAHAVDALREQPFELALGLVGGGADARPLLGRQRPERLEDLRQLAGASQVPDPDRLQLGGRRGGADRGARLGRHGFDARVAHARLQRAWALAVSVSLANAPGSRTASSARTLRSSRTPAFFSAAMKREYDTPASRQAALMRTIHSARCVRFFCLRWRYAKAPARRTVSAAVRYSLRRPPT